MEKRTSDWENLDRGWEEVVRREGGVDWNDDTAWNHGRMKALSGQRSDWEPLFLFWRRLILLVASRLRISLIPASRVKNVWFRRRSRDTGISLSPLSIPMVLHEMHAAGDILLLGEDLPLVDFAKGSDHAGAINRISGLVSRFARVIGLVGSVSLLDDQAKDHMLVFKPVLQEKISDVINTLKEGHWTGDCVLTVTKFESFFCSHDEASAALSFLSLHGNARYLSVPFKASAADTDFVQGVKLSLSTAPVRVVPSLDFDLLKLVWTEEKLEKHIDFLDQSWESSRKKALEYIKSGNKESALRHIRRSKLVAESRHKTGCMLERVEHLLCLLADAESTYKVAEAIKIGSKAIKERSISIEEVHQYMEELDLVVSDFNDVQAALESHPVDSGDIQDEIFEEELGELEAELLEEDVKQYKIQEKLGSLASGPAQSQTQTQELVDSMCQKLSSLNLEPEAA